MRNVKTELLCLAMVAAQVIIFWLNQSSLAGSPRRTNLLVRVVSLTGSSSVDDIRSSSPGRRRDLGFNELTIRNFADELSKEVFKDQMTMTSLGLPKGLQLL
jgi:hypothetical protein